MKIVPVVLSCCLLVVALPVPVRAAPSDSVVKINASVRFPDPTRPWAKGEGVANSGTGVIIEGQRILTNAHLVMYATEVYVEARPGGDKVEAKVQFLAPEVDLAVLTIQEDKFFQKKPPLGRSSKLPAVQDSVVVYGFPIGGNGLSVTRGEISRILFTGYGNHGVGVTIQVTAPINPGNSGGPAVVAGKMVGLVYSRVNGAQNIGGVIPNEEIELFLDDIKDGRYDGKPFEATRTVYQVLENEALRRMLKVDAGVKGILVHPPRRAGVDYPFKPFDIVTRIGDHDIDNRGMVQLENGLQAPFQYLVPRLARDHRVPMTIRRQGKLIRVSLPVTNRDESLIRAYRGEPLSYFIHGPLVFAPAKVEDISLYAQLNRLLYADNSPLVTRNYDTVQFPGEELVVVSAPMFAHRITKGYGNPVGKVVKEVNGVAIKNLRHLVETLRDCTDEYLTFRFADNWSEVLVFNRNELEKATDSILEDQGIAVTRRGSADMLKVWRAKARSSR